MLSLRFGMQALQTRWDNLVTNVAVAREHWQKRRSLPVAPTLVYHNVRRDLQYHVGSSGVVPTRGSAAFFKQSCPDLEVQQSTDSDCDLERLVDDTTLRSSPPGLCTTRRLHVSVLKDDTKTRLGVEIRQHRHCLEIKCVGEGLISRWNEHHPESTVCAGDRLIEVNGVRGPPLDCIILRAHRDLDLNMVFEQDGCFPNTWQGVHV